MQFPFLQTLILLTFLVSLLSFKYHYPKYLKALSLFLLLILLVEITGRAFRIYKVGDYNRLLYNIFIPVEYGFYSYLYYHIIQSKAVKKAITIIVPAYLILCLLSLYTISGFYTFNTLNLVAGGIILLILIMIYYYESVFIASKSIVADPAFWISTGLFFFNLVDIPLFGLLNYLHKNTPDILKVLSTTNIVLNHIMYCFFIVGYLSTWKKSN